MEPCSASPAQLKQLMAMLGEGLNQGGIGIGAGIVYTPGAGHKEIFELVKAVGRYEVALFVHIRGGTKQLGFEDFQWVISVLFSLRISSISRISLAIVLGFLSALLPLR